MHAPYSVYSDRRTYITHGGGRHRRRVIGRAKINNHYCLSIFFFSASSDIGEVARVIPYTVQYALRPFLHAVCRRPRSPLQRLSVASAAVGTHILHILYTPLQQLQIAADTSCRSVIL